MHTAQALLAAATRRLADKADNSALEARVLLCHTLQCSRVDLLRDPAQVVSEQDAQRYNALIERRHQGEPVAYLTGEREFWSLPLRVTPATLIPRPETETLVELALSVLPPEQPLRVADLGTGSGAIALALATERPVAEIVATDVSNEALAVARHNARALRIQNVAFRQGSWLEPLANERFFLIAANPPYLGDDDPHLQQGDLRFEPRSALSCGDDSLRALRHIAEQARRHLVPGGWLMLEHGYDQGAAALAMLGKLAYVQLRDQTDLAGRPRIVIGQWPG
jgi:release factor glutamine methyltransferase